MADLITIHHPRHQGVIVQHPCCCTHQGRIIKTQCLKTVQFIAFGYFTDPDVTGVTGKVNWKDANGDHGTEGEPVIFSNQKPCPEDFNWVLFFQTKKEKVPYDHWLELTITAITPKGPVKDAGGTVKRSIWWRHHPTVQEPSVGFSHRMKEMEEKLEKALETKDMDSAERVQREIHNLLIDGGYGGPTVTICYPPPPGPNTAHVTANFLTYGRVNPTSATMNGAWLQPTQGNQINGSYQLTPPPNMNWMYSFGPVASGSYTLNVQAIDSTGQYTTTAQCPVIIP